MPVSCGSPQMNMLSIFSVISLLCCKILGGIFNVVFLNNGGFLCVDLPLREAMSSPNIFSAFAMSFSVMGQLRI